MHSLLVASLLILFSAQPAHPKSFWRSILEKKFALPAYESAPRLANELAASWAADLRPLMYTLEQNLERGVGAGESDEVLLRSFSALTLSVIASRDNADPFLSAEDYNTLLESGLTYFRNERDVRGFDALKGWIHTAAHTADLLKFLARNTKLRPADQARILAALTAKNRDAAAPFAQGEDERMARVILSIVRRPDFDRPAFKVWLADAHTVASFPRPPTVAALRAQQNIRHLLSSLWAELSVDERPSEGAEFARTALREALDTLF